MDPRPCVVPGLGRDDKLAYRRRERRSRRVVCRPVCWAVRGDTPSPEQRSLFRLCQVHVTHVAKDVVLQMYDVAGSSAIQLKSPIDRLLRDVMTISAHRIVQTRMYRPSGKMLFGLEVKNDRLF